MPRPGFHEELEAMELRLLELGELAAASVQNAVEAVIHIADVRFELLPENLLFGCSRAVGSVGNILSVS